MASMLRRHLHVPHEFVCVTDDRRGIDDSVRVVPLPNRLSATPRCIRRLRQFDGGWALRNLGQRIATLDLDIVITDDVTPLFTRPEPVVLWKPEHVDIYCGSLVIHDAGVM